MKKITKQIMSLTIAFCGVLLLAACGGGCGGHHEMHHKHHENRNMAEPQEVVVYEASETIVAEVPMPMMKAKMYTRNGRGGKSEMGYIKFMPSEDGVNMMVDVTDLRPGKDYTVKIYPCGNCDDYSCCANQCMNINLPVLSIDAPGRLTQTFNISGLSCSDLKNAKIVFLRDGGYKAAWGKIKWVSRK